MKTGTVDSRLGVDVEEPDENAAIGGWADGGGGGVGDSVTDLHISKFVSPSRTSDFEKFCKETIPIIQPALTLVTGDLTDAKAKDGLGSDQIEVEWQTYQTILKRSKVMEKTKWIDIKGNHDTFNVPSLESVRNYYRKYSVWQKDGSFHYVHRTPFGKYSFTCVDASLDPGPKRPYNFFGILNEDKMAKLSALISESHDSNHTILFGHYPTSSIISVSPGIRAAMRYRILAFDHDLFSFADLKFEEWPVVLITNPKSYLYSSYAHEPLQRILHSTHIRILAFSPSPIKFVKIMIDDIYLGDAIQVSGPLYVLKWSPQNYSQGFHQIAVTVEDASGRSATQLHTFAMQENLSLKFGLLASWLLLNDHYIWVRTFFVLLIIFQVVLLIIFRFREKPKFKEPPGVAERTSFSLHVLSKTDLFFYSFLVLNLYTIIGPWFVGEIIEGHMGICFSFGLIINGHFFEGSSTFLVGILQVLFFNLPLMAYTCWCLLLRCQGQCFRSHLYLIKPYWTVPIHLIMSLLFFWQVFSCYFLLKTYGTLSFFLSPLRTWLVVLSFFLVYRIWAMESIVLRTFIVDMKNYQAS
ncbi:hypothetical protein Chor_016652 [Crotalus horridus]